MEILLQLVFSGIALGMIYAVIAFGYQLTFATSGTLNFGQGESLMLGALVGLSLVGYPRRPLHELLLMIPS
jgi:branched-chain amino acid transport system permease protein